MCISIHVFDRTETASEWRLKGKVFFCLGGIWGELYEYLSPVLALVFTNFRAKLETRLPTSVSLASSSKKSLHIDLKTLNVEGV